MNSQNQYHLSFNPRGQPKNNKAQKQIRYVPKLNQNKYGNPSWKQNLQYQQQADVKITPQTRQFKIPLNPNDSGYISNKSLAGRKTQQSQRRQQQRKKQQIIKRVKQLQDKVLPMIERDKEEEEVNQTGWQSRIQLKLLRIETCLDAIRKEWEVQMQKKLAEVQANWQNKFEELTTRTQT